MKKDIFIAQAIQAVLTLLSKIPLPLMRKAGRILGRLIQACDKRHKNIVLDNLRLSFPDKDALWINQTARMCFEHLGMVICELPFLSAAPLEKLVRITRVHGLNRLDPLLERKQGYFALTGHIGNWEWCNLLLGALGYRGNVIARPLDNKSLDIVVNHWRERSGQTVVSKFVSARKILPLLKSGQGVGILLDQNMDWYDGPWVDFFGRPACTNHGLALLAMFTKLPVFPLYCFRAEDGYFDIHVDEPLELCLSGDRSKDVWLNTQNYTKALENIIRQKPAQWLWLHQRWKTKNYSPWPRKKRTKKYA